jgi:hypothetical protein
LGVSFCWVEGVGEGAGGTCKQNVQHRPFFRTSGTMQRWPSCRALLMSADLSSNLPSSEPEPSTGGVDAASSPANPLNGARESSVGGAGVQGSPGGQERGRLGRVGSFLFGGIFQLFRTLVGGVLVIVAGAWALSVLGPSASEGSGPSHQTTQRAASANQLKGRVIREEGAPVFAAARMASRLRTSFAAGEVLKFTGFCIGPPVPSVANEGTDERWLILTTGGLMPAADLTTSDLTWRSTPTACPHELGGVTLPYGPHSLSLLKPESDKKLVVLRASVSHATMVGFALFVARTDKWRALPLQFSSRYGFKVRVAYPGQAAALAAACWALGIPARRKDSEDFVAEVKRLSGTPLRVSARANGEMPEGAKVACSNGGAQSYVNRAHEHRRKRGISTASRPVGPPAPAGSTNTTGQPPIAVPTPGPIGGANPSREQKIKETTAGKEVNDYWQGE